MVVTAAHRYNDLTSNKRRNYNLNKNAFQQDASAAVAVSWCLSGGGVCAQEGCNQPPSPRRGQNDRRL